MTTYHGGAAFPTYSIGEFGMTLRDYFAAQAYAARIQTDGLVVTSCTNTLAITKNKTLIKSIVGVMEIAARNSGAESRARLSYADADALIAESQKEETK